MTSFAKKKNIPFNYVCWSPFTVEVGKYAKILFVEKICLAYFFKSDLNTLVIKD